jgi:hypothetical protein
MITLENTASRPWKFNASGQTVIFGAKKAKVVVVKEIQTRAEPEPSDTATRFKIGSGQRRRSTEIRHDKFLEIYDPKNPAHKDLEKHGHLLELDDSVALSILGKHAKKHGGAIKRVSVSDAVIEARALELAKEMVAKGSAVASAPSTPAVEDPLMSKMAAAVAETKAREKASKGG